MLREALLMSHKLEIKQVLINEFIDKHIVLYIIFIQRNTIHQNKNTNTEKYGIMDEFSDTILNERNYIQMHILFCSLYQRSVIDKTNR